MKVTLTGVNFNFTDGFHTEYTSVNLNFNTVGATFNMSGFVQVSVEDYQANMVSPDKLTALVIQKITSDLQAGAPTTAQSK